MHWVNQILCLFYPIHLVDLFQILWVNYNKTFGKSSLVKVNASNIL